MKHIIFLVFVAVSILLVSSVKATEKRVPEHDLCAAVLFAVKSSSSRSGFPELELESVCDNFPLHIREECRLFTKSRHDELVGIVRQDQFYPVKVCQGMLGEDCCWEGNCCHGVEYCCNECDGTCTCSVGGKC
eukprot:TRINITY_DN1029_c5_g1_i1.p1 TRINITY_DN1029_c5_g1~~TRINITY_DN1029_c5_g1_i1.p1  ORF type:complete len:133 (+),score=25.27 TRINITY_DN1029_c5_g1_i1:153-551(+)